MKRFKHSLSNYKLLTGDMGQLLPVNLVEVLPGDTFQQHSSALVRVSPLVAPVMHPVVVRLHHWFVPSRILWEGWEDFITGGPDGEGGSAGAYPTITDNFSEGSLPDYMGVPTGVANTEISALPIRAYNMIFNEYYRDQDLVTEVTEDQVVVQEVAWEKDYFTSARPWPQKGPDITIPLGTTAPVVTTGNPIDYTFPTEGNRLLNLQSGGNNAQWSGSAATGTEAARFGSAFDALETDLSTATAASVNTIREAFALQRYQEARSRYGSRYTEYLRYLGVTPADARLQRPEYLGGGKQTISFSEVLQTSNDGTNGNVGDLFGHGIAAMRSRRYRKFFQEHGYVISLMSVRPKTMYADGLHRLWNRRIKEDYWQKELQHIGQQEILNKEVYLQGVSADDDTFGYQDRYAEYRFQPSTVAGEFRSTLNYWHMARLFASLPTLNQAFTDCTPSKRNYSVQTENVLWCMVSNRIIARRMVDRNAGGRIM